MPYTMHNVIHSKLIVLLKHIKCKSTNCQSLSTTVIILLDVSWDSRNLWLFIGYLHG